MTATTVRQFKHRIGDALALRITVGKWRLRAVRVKPRVSDVTGQARPEGVTVCVMSGPRPAGYGATARDPVTVALFLACFDVPNPARRPGDGFFEDATSLPASIFLDRLCEALGPCELSDHIHDALTG